MGTQLGEALIPIRAVLDKLDGDLAQARKKTEGAMSGIAKVTSGISNSLHTIGKVALGVVAGGLAAVGAGLLTIGRSAVSAASNLNEALNGSSGVFQDAAGWIHEFGKTAAETTGLSAEAFNQMAAQTGAMLTNFGLGVHEAAKSTVMLTGGAADRASIFNTDVSDAMAAVQSGLRGQSEPLLRFGVNMSAAAVQAYALANGMVESGQEMDSETTVLARMGLLMEQTNKIAGDFVNTSDGLANSARIQQARWQNFKAELGTKLLPVVQTFQQLFMNLAATVLPKVLAALGPGFDFIQRGAEAFSGFVESLMGGTPFIDSLTVAIMKLFGNEIGLKFYDIALQVQNFLGRIQELLAPVWEAITSFISFKDILIGLGIAILTVVVPAAVSMILSMLPIIATIAAIVLAVAFVRKVIEEDFLGIRTALTEFWDNKGKPIFEALKTWLSINIPIAIQKLSDFWTNTLQPAIAAVWGFIKDSVIPIFIDIVSWLAENIPVALRTLANFWTTVLQPALAAVWGFIKNTLIPIFLDVVGWLQENIPVAIAKAKDFWDNHLAPALQRVWQFIKESLWPAFLDIGTWLLTTIGTAIEAAAKFWKETLRPALETVYLFIKNYVWPIFEDVGEWLLTTIGTAIEAAAKFWNETLKPALEGVWKFISESLLPAFKDIGTYLGETLKGILNGIETAFNGIKQAIGWVIEKVIEVIEWFKKVGESLPDWLNPGSPTPLELGLRGITKQMKELNQVAMNMPLFNGLGATMPALAMAGAAASQINSGPTSYSANTTIYTNRDPLRVLHAARHLDKLGRLH